MEAAEPTPKKKIQQVKPHVSAEKASKLARQPDTCVQQIRHTKRVIVEPKYLNNLCKGLKECLDPELFLYSTELKGIPIAYKDIKVYQNNSKYVEDQPEMLLEISVEYTLFQPAEGFVLAAVVNRTGASHLGCLVHGLFMARVYDDERNSQEHMIKSKPIGSQVKFRLKRLKVVNHMTVIIGAWVEDENPVQNNDEVQEQNNNISADVVTTSENLNTISNGVNDLTSKKKRKKKKKEQEGQHGSMESVEKPAFPTERIDSIFGDDIGDQTVKKKKKKKKKDFNITANEDTIIETVEQVNWNLAASPTEAALQIQSGEKKKKKKKKKESRVNTNEQIKETLIKKNKVIEISSSVVVVPEIVASEKKKKKRKLNDSIISETGESCEPSKKAIKIEPSAAIVSDYDNISQEVAEVVIKKKKKKKKIKAEPEE